MTIRNRHHGYIQMRLGQIFYNWIDGQTPPRGKAVGGEAGFRLAPGSLVGVDVAYVSPEHEAATPANARVYEGPPVLVVEVLSPSDKQDDVDDKIETYLAAGVRHVWVVQPRRRTITVYRPDSPSRLFNVGDEIAAEPHLPGFRVAVATIFGV